MTKQKNHKVFEFAFEDAPELMIDKYYIIKLDLMMRPEEEFVVRTYCGTLEAIGELIRCLDQDEQNYVDKFGCTMLASADTAAVHQVLLYRGHFSGSPAISSAVCAVYIPITAG